MKKRPDGRYKVSLTIDGKRHWFYGRTKKDAEQRREQFKNTIQAAPNVDYNVTLGQCCRYGYEAPERRWRQIHMNHTYISCAGMCCPPWPKSSWSIYSPICFVN